MKQVKFLGLSALLLAVIAGSAFKVNDGKLTKRFTGSYFTYNAGASNIFLPSNYTLAGSQSYIGGNNDVLAWVFVDASEIYPSNHGTYPSKPKVDVTSTIKSALTTAFAASPKIDVIETNPVYTEVELKPL